MENLLGSTHDYWLIAALTLLGIGVCGLVIHTIRRANRYGDQFFETRIDIPRWPLDHRKHRHHDDPNWILGVGITAALLALYTVTDDRDTRIIAEAEAERAQIAAGYLPDRAARLRVNLNDCPPRTDGMTDQVVMVIATRADGVHTLAGCSRIAHRQYVREAGKGGRG